MIRTTKRPPPHPTTPRPARRARRRLGRAGGAAPALVLAGAWLGGGAPASAEGPNAHDVAAARSLGQEGVRLADEGRCGEAIEKLERAELLYHAPTLLGRLGECQVAVGKVVVGTENLRRVAREPLPPNATHAFVAAKARAQRVLEQALPQLARLRVVVRAPADARAAVAVDGEPLPAEQVGLDRFADPGELEVEASAPGFRKASRRVKLAPGESVAITLALEPEPSAARAEAPGAGRDERRRAGGGPPPWALAAFGVGAAGLATGAALGAVTLARKSELEESCPAGACQSPGQQRDIDAMQRTGDWSTVAFAVGGAGVGVGALLWWLAPAREGAPRAAGRGGGVELGAWAAGPAAGLRGRFP